MTGTLSGYLVYRLQESIKTDTGTELPYQVIVDALTKSLLELDNDMRIRETIELPNGAMLTMKWSPTN